MALALTLYIGAMLGVVMILFFGLWDGSEGRSATRAAAAALFCIACIWGHFQVMYGMIQECQQNEQEIASEGVVID